MAANLLRSAALAVAGFMMVPYYIGEFGIAVYAILPLAITVTSYFVAVSDSISNAFSRYVAIAVQNRDADGVSRAFTSGVVGMGAFLLAALPLILMLSYAAPAIFDTGSASPGEVRLLFAMVLVSSLLVSFSACFGSVFMAYNRLYITYFAKIANCLSQIGIVVAVFAASGPSLAVVGASYLAAALLLNAVLVVCLRRLCPELRMSRGHYSRELMREMGGLGAWATVAELGSLLFIQASLVAVNLYLGSGVQGTFSVAANMVSMLNTVCASLGAAALPLVYRSYAEGDREGMVRTLRIFTKFVGTAMAFPVAYLMVFAPQVIGIWIGPGYEEIYPMLYAMLPAEVAVSTAYALLDVPLIYARMRAVAIATCAIGAANAALSVLVLQLTGLGAVGVCAVWTASVLALKLVFYPMFASYLTGGTLWGYVRPLACSHLAFAALLAAGWAASSLFTLPATWPAVLLSLGAALPVYFALMMRFAFSRDERAVVVTYLPGFVQRMLRA